MTREGCLSYRRRTLSALSICCEDEQDCGGPPTCSPWMMASVVTLESLICDQLSPEALSLLSSRPLAPQLTRQHPCTVHQEQKASHTPDWTSYLPPKAAPHPFSLSHLLESLHFVPARKLGSDTTPVSPSHVLAASLWVGWSLCFVCFIFFPKEYILLMYSSLTVFQVHSKVIQLYIDTYYF